MSPEMTTVLEAMRRAQEKIVFYREPCNKISDKRFVEVLVEIFDDPKVVGAMALLSPVLGDRHLGWLGGPKHDDSENSLAEKALAQALPGS